MGTWHRVWGRGHGGAWVQGHGHRAWGHGTGRGDMSMAVRHECGHRDVGVGVWHGDMGHLGTGHGDMGTAVRGVGAGAGVRAWSVVEDVGTWAQSMGTSNGDRDMRVGGGMGTQRAGGTWAACGDVGMGTRVWAQGMGTWGMGTGTGLRARGRGDGAVGTGGRDPVAWAWGQGHGHRATGVAPGGGGRVTWGGTGWVTWGGTGWVTPRRWRRACAWARQRAARWH